MFKAKELMRNAHGEIFDAKCLRRLIQNVFCDWPLGPLGPWPLGANWTQAPKAPWARAPRGQLGPGPRGPWARAPSEPEPVEPELELARFGLSR